MRQILIDPTTLADAMDVKLPKKKKKKDTVEDIVLREEEEDEE